MRMLLSVILFIMCSCSNDSGKLLEKKNVLDSVIKQSTFPFPDYYNKIEKSNLDSLKKYKLESINIKCKCILNALFFDDSIFINNSNKKITLGTTQIKLFSFINESYKFKRLDYEFFISDTSLVPWEVNRNLKTSIVNSFLIDIEQQKIIRANISPYVTVNIKDLMRNFLYQLNSNEFKEFCKENNTNKNYLIYCTPTALVRGTRNKSKMK